MLMLKITILGILAASAVGSSPATKMQSDEAKVAAARACSGTQWRRKGYNSYQECTADHINYYPDLPPSQDPL